MTSRDSFHIQNHLIHAVTTSRMYDNGYAYPRWKNAK